MHTHIDCLADIFSTQEGLLTEHTHKKSYKLASQGREKPPSRTAEPQEARCLISRIKLANTRFVHEPTW